jgi:hypothetical protein
MAKMMTLSKSFFLGITVLFFTLVLFPLLTLSFNPGSGGDNLDLLKRRNAEDFLLDDVFRIDILKIQVDFDYYPEEYYADCYAAVKFKMRPGQNRPVIHMDPAIRYDSVISIILNGEFLNFSDESDVRVLSYEETSQQALEFRRDLGADIIHTLEFFYRMPLPEGYTRFSSEVSDLEGRGNEEFFPTLNTPHELARHVLSFRVHSSRAFRFIGSGHVAEVDSDVQQWILDTEREVSSSMVMFVLMPLEDTLYEERNIAGVDVRILAYSGGASIDEAFSRLEQWLPELISNIGPFPMPRGLSIFLVTHGGGMEYYGGTITALRALEHEIFHMYYGCSTVCKTYRDSWLDEAIDMWYELSVDPNFTPIPDDYISNIVSGRSPVAVGFDLRAYDEGARIIQSVAFEIGGRNAMISFLSYLHQNYFFAPFSTWEFLDYLENYSGLDMRDQFSDWLYMGEESPPASVLEFRPHMKKVDMTPPRIILKKYAEQKRRLK